MNRIITLLTAEIVFDLIDLKISGRGKSYRCEDNKKLHDDWGCKMTLRKCLCFQQLLSAFYKKY